MAQILVGVPEGFTWRSSSIYSCCPPQVQHRARPSRRGKNEQILRWAGSRRGGRGDQIFALAETVEAPRHAREPETVAAVAPQKGRGGRQVLEHDSEDLRGQVVERAILTPEGLRVRVRNICLGRAIARVVSQSSIIIASG